jgi:hypothetical protein
MDGVMARVKGLSRLIGAMVCGLGILAVAPELTAQQPPPPAGRAGGPAADRRSPRDAAPTDFTGTWVAVVSEDWRYRMMTAPRGDAAGIPLNAEGTRVANAWDIAADLARGEQCRPFGAAGIMRMPVRLRIAWRDAATLQIDIDNGTQTRLLRFDASARPPATPSWQGFSRASWETNEEGQAFQQFPGGQISGQIGLRPGLSGSLKAVTTAMRAGYLRRNGVPYSAGATLTEYLDRSDEEGGDSWLVVTAIVDDPQYLATPYVTTSHFKREPDASKFQPRPCELTPPVVGSAPR